MRREGEGRLGLCCSAKLACPLGVAERAASPRRAGAQASAARCGRGAPRIGGCRAGGGRGLHRRGAHISGANRPNRPLPADGSSGRPRPPAPRRPPRPAPVRALRLPPRRCLQQRPVFAGLARRRRVKRGAVVVAPSSRPLGEPGVSSPGHHPSASGPGPLRLPFHLLSFPRI